MFFIITELAARAILIFSGLALAAYAVWGW